MTQGVSWNCYMVLAALLAVGARAGRPIPGSTVCTAIWCERNPCDGGSPCAPGETCMKGVCPCHYTCVAATEPKPEPQPKCQQVYCLADPCATVKCGWNTTCVASFSGGCTASCQHVEEVAPLQSDPVELPTSGAAPAASPSFLAALWGHLLRLWFN